MKKNKFISIIQKLSTEFLLILIICLFLFPACKNPAGKKSAHIPNPEQLTAFDQRLANMMMEMDIKDYSYAIINDEKILKTGGSQDENSIFPIGSMSAIFGATMVYQLIEQGKLDLKEKPETSIGNKRTLRHIMTHTFPETDEFNFQITNIDHTAEVIEQVASSDIRSVFKKNIIKKTGLTNTRLKEEMLFSEGCESSIRDLSLFSIALDQQKLFKNNDTHANMFRQVYRGNGELNPSGTGWFIQFYYDRKFAWSFGTGKNYSALMIKSLSDSLSIIILSRSENLNKPFSLEKGQVLNSPVAMEFLKTFLLHDTGLPQINLKSSENELSNILKSVDTSVYRNLLIKEYISYIRFYSFIENREAANRLLRIFKNARPSDLPADFILSEPLVYIDDVIDYIHYKRNFTIEKDTVLTVFAVGERTKEMSHSTWDYDNAELYFNPTNAKGTIYNDTFHFQYRFNYDISDSITGKSRKVENIEFVQSDPTNDSYIFEIKIPWKNLNFKPESGHIMGFDLSISDNDGNSREHLMNWHFQKNQKAWENPQDFGLMKLLEKFGDFENDSVCYSLKTDNLLVIDGKIDAAWKTTKTFSIVRTISDSVPEASDLTARFSSLWDQKNIYFLIEVKDNFKSRLDISNDFGWIENENNDTIWMMDVDKAPYAGGQKTNRYVKEKILLKKGRYILNYQTNQSNSYYHWEGKRPEFSYYGIAVY